MRKWILLSCLLLTGCKVGPNFRPPCVDVPEDWRTILPSEEGALCAEWWREFGDPVLPQLIETALWQNRDIHIATARIEEFLGQYRIARADLLPFISLDTTEGRQRFSEQIFNTGGSNPSNLFEAVLSGSWEIDFWGKLRRAEEAAYADLLASDEAKRTVVLTLVSAVANAYVDLLRYDRQLVISKETARSRKETVDLFTLRHEAGVISKVELSQIESEYYDAVSAIYQFENLVAITENALSVLLGKYPGPIPRGGTLAELQKPIIPAALPSQVLCMRPDILEAEQLLIAANARIGVARAAYFPTIALTGSYGRASQELSKLLRASAEEWSYFAPTSTPIFTGGRIAGNVQTASAIRNQALENYLLRIQIAFQEVDDSLSGIDQQQERLKAKGDQVDALNTYVELAQLRYDEGYSGYLEVLDAERSQFNAELQYAETLSLVLRSYIDLYKSLGGGWVDIADCLTPANP